MSVKVSIIIPCFNEPEEVFRRSLESVIRQTLEDIEIIIILDNPRNTLLEGIIEEYQRNYRNILLLTPEKNLGRGEARNLGISFAEGEYIAIHDADDLDMSTRLEEQYQYMKKNPEIGVVFSDVLYTDTNGNEIVSHPIISKSSSAPSFFKKPINHVTMFLKREILTEKNISYTSMNHSEDFELWMHLFSKGVQFGYIPKVHTHYLSPDMSMHSDFITKMKAWKLTSLAALWKYRASFYTDIYYYLKICVAILGYVSLLGGKNTYRIQRKTLKLFKETLDKLSIHL